MNRPPFLSQLQISIRVKLLLASMVLLIIPIIGFQYIKELETFLRQDQQHRLLENARMIASVIASQKKLQTSFKHLDSSTATEHIYVRPLSSPILLDGFNDDWQYNQVESKNPRVFKSTLSNSNEQESDPAEFEFSTGYKNKNLYVFFKVKDKHLNYQPAKNRSITQCDHILIVTENTAGQLSHYIIATFSPGGIQAKEIIREGRNSFRYKLFPRIQASWQETSKGYNVELRMPKSVTGKNIVFAVVDLDNKATPTQKEILTTSQQNSIENLSTISLPQASLNDLVQQLSTPLSRTWLINPKRKVVAVSGSMYDEEKEASEFESPDNINLSPIQFIEGLIRLFYQSLLPVPDERFNDDDSMVSTLTGSDIDSALAGTATTQWRLTDNTDVNILRAVYPIVVDQNTIGAVAVEKNSNSILLLQNRAVEILMNTSILVFLLSTLILVSFASRLSYRIRRLRNETCKAISDDGRIQTDQISAYMLSTNQGDEIDDLKVSYADMLVRLGDYNRYLESMSSKLSHELRTPITVVKSSLENFESGQTDTKNSVFLDRAKDGVNRLNDILTRMSEATRLEQTLEAEQKQSIDICKIVSGCVEGYKIAHGEHSIRLHLDAKLSNEFMIQGCSELIAQMLDKLVSNAFDFSDYTTAVIVSLIKNNDHVILSVTNSGSSLPEHMQSNLFESMVSVRDKRSDQPHLGLGLYIVRLIAEFHEAIPFAKNVMFDGTENALEPQQTQRLPPATADSFQGVEVGVVFKSMPKNGENIDTDEEK